jgi:hypothetical protein
MVVKIVIALLAWMCHRSPRRQIRLITIVLQRQGRLLGCRSYMVAACERPAAGLDPPTFARHRLDGVHNHRLITTFAALDRTRRQRTD